MNTQLSDCQSKSDMERTIINVLLIEDNPAEANLTIEALKEWKSQTIVQAIHFGDEALKYLKRQEPYTMVKRPDLIFLDLNLPRKHGLDVLREIKADPDLKMIPILILTISAAEGDIRAAYQFGANSYIQKTLEFDQFIATMQKIEEYWFSVATLPTR